MRERLTTDAFGALDTLDRAVRLRASGGSFDLALHLDDDRGSVAAILAEKVCRTNRDPASRRAALERIGISDTGVGQNPLLGFATMDLATKATVRDLAVLADTLVFRSWAEMRRAVMTFDIVHHAYSIEPSVDALVPQPLARERNDGSIVIWAPDEPVERLYIVLTAAAETGRPARVVCKGGDLANIPAELIALEDASSALSRAAVCVAASMSDPGQAIALARWGIPLCAAFTSGAYEWADGVTSYRSWSLQSVASALATAPAAPVPRVASILPQQQTREVSQCDALVTVVMRAQRGDVSAATMASIEAQKNVKCETIVVNSADALRNAVSTAGGSYVVFLQDRDVLFHDGISTLASALERSQADVAYGDGVLAYLVEAPGPRVVLGYSVLDRMPVWARTMAAHDEFVGSYFRVMFRREALVRVGLDEALDDLVVYDAFLRILEQSTAVHVASVCGMSFRYLDGRIPGSNPVNLAREYERIHARVPATDSAVNAARDAVRSQLQKNERIGLRPPPQRLNPPAPWL